MKFDAHVSNVGFILYLVAQVFPEPQKANQSYVPRFLTQSKSSAGDRHSNSCNEYLSPARRDRQYTGNCISSADTSTLVSEKDQQPNDRFMRVDHSLDHSLLAYPLEFWNRASRNRICEYRREQYRSILFKHYLRILFTTRCPVCRQVGLYIHSQRRNIYRIYCRKCGTNTEWWE